MLRHENIGISSSGDLYCAYMNFAVAQSRYVSALHRFPWRSTMPTELSPIPYGLSCMYDDVYYLSACTKGGTQAFDSPVRAS